MKVDAPLFTADLREVPRIARELEDLGYDGIFSAETSHDPFFPLVLAAEHTSRVDLATAIAVAFPRSPMHLAQIGWDLQAASEGRFILGLGSQIKAHIEKRFSIPWSRPAARMRELILAMHAIWRSWNEGEKLDFRGEFYTHTLMTPFFSPGPNPHGVPKVLLAAVGEKMTEVAGEVADGMLVHGFTTERYFREVTLPALDRGLAKAGRTREGFTLSCPVFIITGTTDDEIAQARFGVCQQISFYGSTPAYRGVLELHGWGDLQTELNTLSKQGRWLDMGTLITDDILEVFAITGAPEEIPAKLLGRYGDVLDRISFYAPYHADPDRWAAMLAALHA